MNCFTIWYLVLLGLSAAAYHLPPVQRGAIQRYAEVSNEIGYHLQRAQSYQRGNQLFSPYGTSTLLSILYQGSSGYTRQQLGNVGYVALEQEGDDISYSHQQLRRYLQQSSAGSQFEEATILLYPTDYSISPQYQQVLESAYRCLVQEDDSDQQKESVAQEVSRWIHQQTRGKLAQIVANVYASSGLALLNGIYYQGSLQTQSYVQVHQRPFYNQDETTSPSVLYYQTESVYPYYEDQQLQAIQVPYYGGDYSLLVVLPSQQNEVSQLQQQVSYNAIQRILSTSQQTPVRLSLPQFRLDSSRQLEQDIQSLGITSIFRTGAELSGFSTGGRSYVSQIAQRVVVQVGKSRQQYYYGYGLEGQYGDQQQYGYGGEWDDQYEREQDYEYGSQQRGQYEGQYQNGGYEDKHQYQYGGLQGRQYGDEQQYQYDGIQSGQYGHEQQYQYGGRQGGQYEDEQQFQYGGLQGRQYEDEQQYQYDGIQSGQYGHEQQYQYGGRQGGQYEDEQQFQYGGLQGRQYVDKQQYQYGGIQSGQYGREQQYQYGGRQGGQYEDEQQFQYGGLQGRQYEDEQQYQYGSHQGYQYGRGQQYQYGVPWNDQYQVRLRYDYRQRYGQYYSGEESQYGSSEEGEYQYRPSIQGGKYMREFQADRPFLFYVVHNPTGLNLIAGRVSHL